MESLPNVGYPFQGAKVEEDDNMISNGQFDMGTTGWDIQNNAGATSTMESVTGAGMSGPKALRVCPENAGTANWHIQLRQLTPINTGKKYSISFMAKADDSRTIDVAIQQDGDPYTTHFEQQVTLASDSQSFSYEFTSSVDDPIATLKFYIGNNTSCVYIDNVEMYEIVENSSNVYELSKQSSFKVYPNPFNNNFTISSNTSFNKGQYQLMNVSGKVLRSGDFNGQKTIETADLGNGFYILRVEDGTFSESIKLIKK